MQERAAAKLKHTHTHTRAHRKRASDRKERKKRESCTVVSASQGRPLSVDEKRCDYFTAGPQVTAPVVGGVGVRDGTARERSREKNRHGLFAAALHVHVEKED